MRAFVSSVTGPFWGAATNRRPHGRQRNVGVPAAFGPFRTTWVAAHRGQAGTGAGSGVAVVILSEYDHAAQWATTKKCDQL